MYWTTREGKKLKITEMLITEWEKLKNSPK